MKGVRLLPSLLSGVLPLILLSPPLEAVEIRAEVERDVVEVGEEIVLRLTVDGASDGVSPIPPPLPDFTVSSGGSTSSFQIVNGRVSSRMIYTYNLYPHRKGDFLIGPFKVRYRGKEYETQPIRVTVREGGIPEGGEEEGGGRVAPLFVSASVTDTSPYFREPILYTFRFFRAVNAVNPRLEKPPFDGFSVVETGGKAERNYTRQIKGIRFDVTEIVVPLIPSEIKDIVIPPSTLICEVVKRRDRRGRSIFDEFFSDPFFSDPFFGFSESETRLLKTEEVKVSVRPFPREGRPEGFSNLVGNFGMSAGTSKREVPLGDSVTLTVEIAGQGNIMDAVLPEIEIDGVRIYDDKGEEEFRIKGGTIEGRKVFRKALVPYVAGDIEIPEISLVFFDPESDIYRSVSTSPFVISIKGGEMVQRSPSLEEDEMEKVGIKITGEDILPIYTGRGGIDSQIPDLKSPVFLLSSLVPPLLSLSLFLVKRRKEELKRNVEEMMRRRARRDLVRELKGVPRILRRGGEREAFSLIAGSFKDFIGKKVGVEGRSLTARDVEGVLSGRGVPQEMREEVSGILREVETSLFGRDQKGDHDAPVRMARRMKRAARILERYL